MEALSETTRKHEITEQRAAYLPCPAAFILTPIHEPHREAKSNCTWYYRACYLRVFGFRKMRYVRERKEVRQGAHNNCLYSHLRVHK